MKKISSSRKRMIKKMKKKGASAEEIKLYTYIVDHIAEEIGKDMGISKERAQDGAYALLVNDYAILTYNEETGGYGLRPKFPDGMEPPPIFQPSSANIH